MYLADFVLLVIAIGAIFMALRYRSRWLNQKEINRLREQAYR